MRFSLASFFILATAVFTACQTGPELPASAPEITSEKATPAAEAPKADDHSHDDMAPRIELAEAKSLFDAGDAVFIDTRSEESFVTEHIKGAINIPFAGFEDRVKEVPKGKTIIAYCS